MGTAMRSWGRLRVAGALNLWDWGLRFRVWGVGARIEVNSWPETAKKMPIKGVGVIIWERN